MAVSMDEAAALKHIPFFSTLDETQLIHLDKACRRRLLDADQVVFHEGDEPDGMYVLLAGRVRIYRQDDRGNEVQLATREAGSFFGEMALLENLPRSATVATLAPSEFLILDRPAFISEFGCPAYQAGKPREVSELGQALYHFGSWIDLEDNMAGRGVGNALGGVVFAWVDEWWKAGQPPRFSPTVQETIFNWPGPFPGGHMFEEWLGVVSQGDGSASPFLRQLRPSYRFYQQVWQASD